MEKGVKVGFKTMTIYTSKKFQWLHLQSLQQGPFPAAAKIGAFVKPYSTMLQVTEFK